jgi:ribosomal protein S1
VKKLSVTLSDGAKPSIGTTLTPVKSTRAKKAAAKVPTKVAKVPRKAKKSLKVVEAEKKPAKATKKSLVKVAKAPPKPKKTTKSIEAPAPPPPAVALRRGRHPVNPDADFALFRASHRIGSRVEGEVTAFTSHGAVIKVALKNGQSIECYAPTTSLGTPAPARARDVLKRGDRRTFRLVTVDAERRIAELALQ